MSFRKLVIVWFLDTLEGDMKLLQSQIRLPVVSNSEMSFLRTGWGVCLKPTPQLQMFYVSFSEPQMQNAHNWWLKTRCLFYHSSGGRRQKVLLSAGPHSLRRLHGRIFPYISQSWVVPGGTGLFTCNTNAWLRLYQVFFSFTLCLILVGL